jgi:hypothetical protein
MFTTAIELTTSYVYYSDVVPELLQTYDVVSSDVL